MRPLVPHRPGGSPQLRFLVFRHPAPHPPSRLPGVYRLPEDCLRPLKINHSSFELIGRDILLHTTYQPEPDNGLELTYITNALGKAEILPDSQPLFLRGLSLLLAARMAPKITGQPQLSFTLEEAANSALAEALHKDALAQHSNDQHPLERILGLSIVG